MSKKDSRIQLENFQGISAEQLHFKSGRHINFFFFTKIQVPRINWSILVPRINWSMSIQNYYQNQLKIQIPIDKYKN